MEDPSGFRAIMLIMGSDCPAFGGDRQSVDLELIVCQCLSATWKLSCSETIKSQCEHLFVPFILKDQFYKRISCFFSSLGSETSIQSHLSITPAQKPEAIMSTP